MEKKFNIVFLTINFINGKQYIGDHATSNLNDHYKGSGLILRKAFKEYGKKNFKCKILEQFDTKQEAFDAQEKYIIKYKTHVSQNGYNISWKGGHNVKDCIAEETKQKIGNSNRGKKRSNEYKENLSFKMSGENNPMYNYQYTKEQLQKLKENNLKEKNPMFGKTLSEKSKKIISQKNKGRIKSEEEILKISIGNTGKIRSDKLKKQISNKLKGRTLSNEHIQKLKKPKSEYHKEAMKVTWKIRRIEKPMTEETKNKIRKSVNKYYQSKEYINKLNN